MVVTWFVDPSYVLKGMFDFLHCFEGESLRRVNSRQRGRICDGLTEFN